MQQTESSEIFLATKAIRSFFQALQTSYPHIISPANCLCFDEIAKKLTNDSLEINDVHKILCTIFTTLEKNQIIFYEYREMAITQNWLSTLKDYRVISTHKNDGLIIAEYCQDFLECLGTDQQAAAEFVVMGYYRVGLTVQKY